MKMWDKEEHESTKQRGDDKSVFHNDLARLAARCRPSRVAHASRVRGFPGKIISARRRKSEPNWHQHARHTCATRRLQSHARDLWGGAQLLACKSRQLCRDCDF